MIVLLLGFVAVRDGGDDETNVDRTAAASWERRSESGRTPVPVTEPAPPETTSTTEPPGPTEVTMLFAGDLLPHTAVNERAAELGRASGRDYDYAPMFAPMRSIISGADVAVCHMEVPSAPDGEQPTSYPAFGAPPELVDGAAAAGYDGCTTASNHSLDRGQAGLGRLLDQLDANDMGHAGTARSQQEAGTTTLYEVDGVQIASLSYAYDFNGYKIPADAPWSVNQIDPDRITADAAKARADGAELVLVSLHFGNEYQHDPSDYQRRVVDQLLPSDDISAVIGHHAHVVQPIERVDGTYVVWGLGNQVSNQEQLPRRDGLTVRLTATEAADGAWSVSKVDAIPTYVDLTSFDIHPAIVGAGRPATSDRLRTELSASYDRTADVLNGTPTEGVTLAPKP